MTREDPGGFQDGRLSETGSREDFKPVKLKANGLPNNNKNHNRKTFVLTKAANEYNVLKPPGNSGKSPSNLDVSSLVIQAVKRGRDVASKKEKNSVDDNFQETRANDADKVLEMAVLRNGKNREPNQDTGTGSEMSPKDHGRQRGRVWSAPRTRDSEVPSTSPALDTGWICFSVVPSSNPQPHL